MSHECFQDALLLLKESSKAAVADAVCELFDENKKYLHIQRDVESELEAILEASMRSSAGKLVLVCGNVGDGKSHLISVLLQNHAEYRDPTFKIYNDATESSSPTATNIDELRSILSPYTDENLSACTQNAILAINLGTLNNFLVAEQSNGFSKLAEFVERKQILEVGSPRENEFDSESPFQFVNLSDHNLFYLTSAGAVSPIIETALEKISSRAPYVNPFHNAYTQCCLDCPAACPIKVNYELLQDGGVRKTVSDLLIQCIIKHHHIISIRALYNFIFDLIVPAELDGLSKEDITAWALASSSGDYLERLFPNHLFEHPNISDIFSHLHLLDPALRRSAWLDDQIVSLITKEDPTDLLRDLGGPAYLQETLARHVKSSGSGHDTLVKTYVRLMYFSKFELDENQFLDSAYRDYLRLLYSWHVGERSELKGLYKLIQRTILAWEGKAPAGEMLLELGNQQLKYRLSEKVAVAPTDIPSETVPQEEVRKFSTILPLAFQASDNSGSPLTIHVDYRLYEMACMVDSGCRANESDKANFIAFTSFTKDIMQTGELNTRLRVTEAETGKTFILELDDFGDFTFKGVLQ